MSMEYGICEYCYDALDAQGEQHGYVFESICAHHIQLGICSQLQLLQKFPLPLSLEMILTTLENMQFIKTFETLQDIFIIPRLTGKHNGIPIYCSRQYLKCPTLVSGVKNIENK